MLVLCDELNVAPPSLGDGRIVLVDHLKVEGIGAVGVETTHSPLTGVPKAQLCVGHAGALNAQSHT